ncbi:serine carboxypeptidase [Rhexocercosporidium sp. MPI-PUGE-AT-0058]|nr:serine carboxypeptidase [Rhexocercosporidium sp. MPI-PUGE-AT-0058]
MHSAKCLFVLVLVSLVGALQNPHEEAAKFLKRSTPPESAENNLRSSNGGLFLNQRTAKFAVKGNELPEVDFNIGESYAGTLPIDPPTVANANSLWFWFFPSTNPAAKKEIVIWLSGGPGCSSLSAVLQGNGPFSWLSGTYKPVANAYSWNKLTNVIYVDQPVGTGFSQGNILVNNETEVATHFMGFWKNFVDTFSIQGYKIYITGESSSAMLENGNKTYFNVTGVQINDPVVNYPDTLQQVPVVPALEKYKSVIGLDDTVVAGFKARADSCGYTTYHSRHTTNFPPTGPIPAPPSSASPGCSLWGEIVGTAFTANPCFNVYHLTDYCPYLWSELGYPFSGSGPSNYFNRSDVQRAIHAPRTNFFVCETKPNIFPATDQSLPSALGPLPSVIDHTKNVIISHGLLDFLLFADGSLITIQNMTWGGLQGFRTPLGSTFNFNVPNQANQGTTHSERGLTFVTVNLSGHFVLQYTPGAAYRQLEFLLGRISSLEQTGKFTTG